FFFQAEDGIRDKLVTGVQTCALPISAHHRPFAFDFGYAFAIRSAATRISACACAVVTPARKRPMMRRNPWLRFGSSWSGTYSCSGAGPNATRTLDGMMPTTVWGVSLRRSV